MRKLGCLLSVVFLLSACVSLSVAVIHDVSPVMALPAIGIAVMLGVKGMRAE